MVGKSQRTGADLSPRTGVRSLPDQSHHSAGVAIRVACVGMPTRNLAAVPFSLLRLALITQFSTCGFSASLGGRA